MSRSRSVLNARRDLHDERRKLAVERPAGTVNCEDEWKALGEKQREIDAGIERLMEGINHAS